MCYPKELKAEFFDPTPKSQGLDRLKPASAITLMIGIKPKAQSTLPKATPQNLIEHARQHTPEEASPRFYRQPALNDNFCSIAAINAFFGQEKIHAHHVIRVLHKCAKESQQGIANIDINNLPGHFSPLLMDALENNQSVLVSQDAFLAEQKQASASINKSASTNPFKKLVKNTQKLFSSDPTKYKASSNDNQPRTLSPQETNFIATQFAQDHDDIVNHLNSPLAYVWRRFSNTSYPKLFPGESPQNKPSLGQIEFTPELWFEAMGGVQVEFMPRIINQYKEANQPDVTIHPFANDSLPTTLPKSIICGARGHYFTISKHGDKWYDLGSNGTSTTGMQAAPVFATDQGLAEALIRKEVSYLIY